MTADPRELGCDCDNCPLNKQKPVVPQSITKPKHAKLAFVSEYPGKDETRQNKFFSGPTGALIRERILPKAGIDHRKTHFTNALLCWPQGQITPKEFSAAVAACRPRLDRELRTVEPNAIIAAGKRALQSLTGKLTITSMLGAPTPGVDFFVGGRKKGTKVADFTQYTIVPTFQPAMLFRDRWQFLPIIRKHMRRASLAAEGELPPWEWGKLVLEPDEEMLSSLHDIINDGGSVISVDIETDGIDPWTCDITRIGIATDYVSVSVPWCDWLGVSGVRDCKRRLSQAIKHRTENILLQYRTKVFQNGVFDRMCFRAHSIRCIGPYFDTLYAHMLYSPGTDHKLDFQAAQEFHAPRWKQEFRHGKEGFEK